MRKKERARSNLKGRYLTNTILNAKTVRVKNVTDYRKHFTFYSEGNIEIWMSLKYLHFRCFDLLSKDRFLVRLNSVT